MSLEPNDPTDPNAMGPSLTLPPTKVQENPVPDIHAPHKSWERCQGEIDKEGQEKDEMNEVGPCMHDLIFRIAIGVLLTRRASDRYRSFVLQRTVEMRIFY